MKKVISSLILFFSLSSHADMSLTYPNVPLSSIIETISVSTGKSFTYNVEAGNTPLALEMSGEHSAKVVYKHFVQSLKVSGLKAVELDDNLISIVPANFITTFDKSSDSFQTIVLTLKNVLAKDVAKSLEKSVSLGGYVTESGDHKVIVHDLSSNIKRLRSLIFQLDSMKIEIPVYTTVILNNLLPSEIKAPDGLQVTAYDKVKRLVVYGVPSETDPFIESLNSLDTSLKTIYARLIITTMSKTFTDDFNLVALFQKGAISTDLRSISINTLNPFSDGISVVASLFNQHTEVSILSQPFIQLKEGVSGSFNIGREVPLLSSIIEQDTGQRITNVERKKTGLSVELLARVRPDGLIDVDLRQALSSISETQLEGATDIITDVQDITTSLTLYPGRVYSVGGVLDTRKVKKVSSLPLFSFMDTDESSNDSQQIVIFIEVSLGA